MRNQSMGPEKWLALVLTSVREHRQATKQMFGHEGVPRNETLYVEHMRTGSLLAQDLARAVRATCALLGWLIKLEELPAGELGEPVSPERKVAHELFLIEEGEGEDQKLLQTRVDLTERAYELVDAWDLLVQSRIEKRLMFQLSVKEGGGSLNHEMLEATRKMLGAIAERMQWHPMSAKVEVVIRGQRTAFEWESVEG